VGLAEKMDGKVVFCGRQVRHRREGGDGAGERPEAGRNLLVGNETRLVRRNGVTELLASRTTASGEAAAQLLLHLDWLRRVRNGGASAEELRAAVRRLEARTLRSRGRPDLVSEELAARLVRARRGCGTPAECPDAVALGTPPGLDALKAEDIAEVARRCIDPDRADVAWVGPPSSLHPLGARGRVYEYEVE
ncbi:MAG: hypothetical protein AAFU79_34130, partial [Myxococcota bacterium]